MFYKTQWLYILQKLSVVGIPFEEKEFSWSKV